MEHTFDQTYWDQIWASGRAGAMSSSEPNPHLVREVGDLTPGTAIDAGCGAGAEAIWLADQGWKVTAADIAEAALKVGEQRATHAGLGGQVHWVQADLSTWEPASTYDLVTTHYAHPEIPQLEFYRRIATWVSPGGTLLIVGHLHKHADNGATEVSHKHGPDQTSDAGEAQPPAEASVTAASITDLLDPAVWTIVTAAESPRTVTGPGGHPTTLHDVVLRAVRATRPH